MNDFKRSLLLQFEKDIIGDVTDMVDILSILVSRTVISSQEERIVSQSQKKVPELIKILLSKTEGKWFEEFIKALEKDYSWISRNLRSKFDNEVTEKLIYYLYGRGNVPPLPQHSIRRRKYVEPLREKIRNLKRDFFLVVHGMSGLGKTNLVVDALNDISLLENSFDGYVYWLSVGDLRSDELDDLQCLQLQKKLCNMSNLIINPQRELGPNDLLWELRKHFSMKPNSSSLLILDKVRCSKVIEVLNVGCKILITSQDRDVVKDTFSREYFEISEGFTEQESVQLLKDYVLGGTGELAPRLKECAANIHRTWKGHPLIIRLIGGELSETKEDSQRDVARWKVYERKPQQESNANVSRRRSILADQMRDILDLTTKKLQFDFKNRFFMLSVLVEDANITNEVLKILWGVDIHEVEETMKTLYRRSLVLRKYVDQLEQPVYGIHDVIMEYLKNSISKSDLLNMHKDLMTKFSRHSNNDFSNLPEDSYIFSYLCHHVENAGMWNTYRDQFFTLPYLEKKLKSTGPGDLLLDLHKYQTGLENNQKDYIGKIASIKSLVNDSGWDIHQGDVDIVQCALLQPQSFLHTEAIHTAKSNKSSKLYFYPTACGRRPKELKIDLRNVQAVSLVPNNSANHVDGRVLIYPDSEGLISEIDMHYRCKRRTFRESSSVVMLKMSPFHDKFLTALESGHINIWSMTSENTSSADTPPPSLKQKSHQPFFEDTRSTPCASFKHKLLANCASFSSDGRLVVSASADGVICVWDVEKNISLHELKTHPSPPATACTFVSNDTMIVYGCADFYIYFFQLKNSHQKNSHLTTIDRSKGGLVSLLATPGEGRKLIIVQEKSVDLYSWEVERLKHREEGHRELEFKNMRSQVLYNPLNGVKINCAAFHKDLLVLGTSRGCSILFDVFTQCSPLVLGSEEIKAVDTVNGQVVLAQESSVTMLWPEPNGTLAVRSVVSANLGWNTRHDKPFSVYGMVTSDGIIEVFRDGKMIANKRYPNTCIICVCDQNDHVVIGTSDGAVALFDIVASSINQLFMLPSKITDLCVIMYQNNYVYLATSKETDNSKKLRLEAHFLSHTMKCKISSPVVKAFIHSQAGYLFVVLGDFSLLAWDLKNNSDPSSLTQGRVTADITDACLSEEKNIIVLSDKEYCFHQIFLELPEKKKSTTFDSNIYSRRTAPLLIMSQHQGADEVDGMGLSSSPMIDVRGASDTIPWSTQSWCCSMSPNGDLVAIGHGDCNVLVWDLKSKSALMDFKVHPDRRKKVGQLKFSHHNVQLGKTLYELVLCVVTDCLSFYNLSSILNDNSKMREKVPECIGCVTASGDNIIELSANNSFTMFCAFDLSYSFFSWNVWNENENNM